MFVCLFVRASPLVEVYSYTTIIPRIPNILTDSKPPIKRLIWVPIIGDPDPPNPLDGLAQVFFGV